MKLKGRSLLVIGLLIFGGYAVYEFQRDKKKEMQELEQSRLVTLDYDQIDSIRIESGSKNILLKRNLDGWSIEEPLKDTADNEAVEEFLKGIAVERIIDVAKQGESIDWSIFGLDKGFGKVTFINSLGLKQTFFISENKNFENNFFARRDEEARVLIVGPKWQDRVQKNIMDFRERHLLRHRIAKVNFLRIKNKNGQFELTRQDGAWMSPKKDINLDQNKVREILQIIADAKASEFVEKAEPNFKVLFTLELELDEKKWRAELSQAHDFKIYAKVSDSQIIQKMEPGALDKFIGLTIEELKEVASNESNRLNMPNSEPTKKTEETNK